VRLPDPFPRDPSDRLIAATAMVEGVPLVTADTRIRQSKLVETVW
jgi:PIN domain nuclease of toxin-antitoxin system